MKKAKKILQKHWRLFAILTIPAILGFTYGWFAVKGFVSVGNDLEKRDWLAFWGGFLSFGGSTILGVIAVWQNKQANETNEKMLKETQRLGQVEFENNIKRDQYMRIISGAQKIGQYVSDIRRQLSYVNIELRKEPSAQFAADLLTPIITNIMILREIEIDNFIPIGYDDVFPIVRKNRKIIKDLLQENERRISDDRKELKCQNGKISEEYFIDITIIDTKTALSEIVSFFNSQLDAIDSYKPFMEENSQ